MRNLIIHIIVALALLILLLFPFFLGEEDIDLLRERFRTPPSLENDTIIWKEETVNPLDSSFIEPEKPACCYHTKVDFLDKLTPEFFAQEQLKRSRLYSGHEYEDWMALTLTPFGQALVDPDTPDCEIQWKRLVLDQARAFYLKRILEQYTIYEASEDFPYRKDREGLPRILLLGDSISEGIWVQTEHMYGTLANIHTAPTNCGGFDKYLERLTTWLGDCAWDLIQFNVGMHFHPQEDTGLTPYMEQFEWVIAKLREHSPDAKIVFALTTPSPFDSKDTYPDPETCPNYDLFHPEGFVTELNQVARQLAEKLNVTVNDRYSAILPYLGKYQNPCDIHYALRGYRVMAKSDWKVFSDLLSLEAAPLTSICCYQTISDVEAMYTPAFFEEQKNISTALWSGEEYEEWQEFVATPFGKSLIETNPDNCAAQWRRLVLEESTGSHLKKYLSDLLEHGESTDYPFIECKAGKPRFLLLGDTVTEEVAKLSRELYGSQINIHLAPMNPRSFHDYLESLPVWLGNCAWNLIQFDLGIHFRRCGEGESSLDSYAEDLRATVSHLREHSPEAKIVLALTTPSPLDRNTTTEEKSLCPHGETKFHSAGFIHAMNEIAIQVAEELDVFFIDRYSAILPHLNEYQKPCNMHFTPDGYRILAEVDGTAYKNLGFISDP